MSFHRNLTYVDAHVVHAWEWVDETARLAETGMTSVDLGKFGWQKDTNEFYALIDLTPTWAVTTHVHSNKAILDQIEEPFLTDDRTNLDDLVASGVIGSDNPFTNGFSRTPDNVISADAGTTTFTIEPLGSTFYFYSDGVRFDDQTTQTVQWLDEEGTHHFYLDINGVLQTTTTFTDQIILKFAYVAALYWDSDNSEVIMLMDERHGYKMAAPTHLNLHYGQGTVYLNGLTVSNIGVDGDGSLDVSAQVGINDGSFLDEDIQFNVVNGSPQTIRTIGQFPILYKEGSSKWRKKPADNFPFIQDGVAGFSGTGLIAYSADVAENYSLIEVPEGYYSFTHFFATNELNTPIIGFVGGDVYSTAELAGSGCINEINHLYDEGLLLSEFVLIASVCWQSSTSFTNTVKTRAVTVHGGTHFNWLPKNSNIEYTVHGDLVGLGDDDHPQYHNDTRGDARYTPISHYTDEPIHRVTYKPTRFVTADTPVVSWEVLIVDTRTGATPISLTFPASPTPGDKILVIDGFRWAGTDSIFCLMNGQPLRRIAGNDLEIDLTNRWVEFTYVDATNGWNYRSDA